MIDFKKQLSRPKAGAVLDPVALYETLDRRADKGPLRPAQQAVLEEWHNRRRAERDVIVKLHTGQGKTLIGLLILQARLNETKSPVLYLCPDNYLIEQTRKEAERFGIGTVVAEGELPEEFVNGEKILITSVQKLFNGKTRFKTHQRSIEVGTILLDDAHRCADVIREQLRISFGRDNPAYNALFQVFSSHLEGQGAGTYADLVNKDPAAILPVPYWAWIDHESDVARILSDNSESKEIKFAWPILKDMLSHCQCVISGTAIEIEPYVAPVDVFGTYWKAQRRFFMSATVTDDAFLVRSLGLSEATIRNPLTYENEKWSGEKMILLPGVMDDRLNRQEVVHLFATQKWKSFGVVALVPSFKDTKDWKDYGARIVEKDSISDAVGELRDGKFGAHPTVLVNRYDGIDLPDAACRILIFDRKPYSDNLVDRLEESVRAGSQANLMRTVRTIEQGLGRSVRGEKDFSVIVVVGPDLVKLLRSDVSRRYLSAQMDKQVEIGLTIADIARSQDMAEDADPKVTLLGVASQCLKRDEGWKAFYAEKMEEVEPRAPDGNVLKLFEAERAAEIAYQCGDYGKATTLVQAAIDGRIVPNNDTGWYLQQMARYSYVAARLDFEKYQKAAFGKNRMLLRPPAGVTVSRLTIVGHGRAERLAAWIGGFTTYAQLNVAVSDMLTNLQFGVAADRFEEALNDLSRALGFEGERPDKEWKEGPDNLWVLDANQYILWECKNEVDLERQEVNKHESDQMNRSCAWFAKTYPGAIARNIMITPAKRVGNSAAFMHNVDLMRQGHLKVLRTNVAAFFKSFEAMQFSDLAPTQVQRLIEVHQLTIADLMSERYGARPRGA